MTLDQFSLKDRQALVIGGRGYLGQRLCATLVEAGATVHAADLPELSRVARHEAGVSRDNVLQHNVDVTDPASVNALVDGVLADAGRIDILVYSVTGKPKDFYKPYTECSLEG